MSADPPRQRSFFAELRRRNVLRAAVLYVAAVWALAQGIAQLTPTLGAPEWSTRAFLIAAAVGFPFWLVFAWLFELTPHGLKRESEIAPDASIAHRTGRKLDFAIIAVLAVAVILLLTNTFVWHKGIEGPSTLAQVIAHVPEKSVAVLPFANESGNKDEQFFADGLSEDLINALSQFAGLKVISRHSAFQFRHSRDSSAQIGKMLGVAHLLEGSVQRQADEVRITATLVNAADGRTLWSAHYDRPYKDLFALQDAITNAVAGALKAKLLTAPGVVVQTDRPPNGSLAAYTAYQRGLASRGTEARYRQAITDLKEAIRLAPKYAVAYAALSSKWMGLASYLNDPAQMAQALASARRASATALELDPDSVLAHRARASVLMDVDFDWTGAEAQYRRALELAPSDARTQANLAQLLATLGHNRQALALTRKALAADPRHVAWYNLLSFYLAALGRLDAAQQAAGSIITLNPHATVANIRLTFIAIQRGDAKAALAAARQMRSGVWRDIALTLALQIGPDHAAADAAVKTLIAKYASASSYQIAEVYALRGDPNAMFHWLDRAFANRDGGIHYLLYDPLILRYRNDPRFAAFCAKVGLPATTDAVAMK